MDELPQMSTAGAAETSSFRREFIALARLSLPLAFVQVGFSLMGFVDTVMAGRMSDLALGATGLGSSVFFMVSIIGMGLVLGLDPVASQAFGAGQPRHARRALWQGVYAAAIITLPLTSATLGVAFCLEQFGVVPELAHDARIFVFGRLPSLFPLLMTVALRSYLQAAHVTRTIVLSTIVANVFNLLANIVLGFGDAGLAMLGLPSMGLPALGVFGLALASTVAIVGQTATLALAVRAIAPGEGDEPIRRFNPPMVRQILSIGGPISLSLLAEVGVFSLAQILMGGIGILAAAAHQVTLMFASQSFSVCLGIGAATSVQVGRAIGRQDVTATRRAGISGMLLAATFMLVPGVLMGFWPEGVVAIMTTKPDVVPLACTLMRIAAVFQLADGVQAVASGALRGAGITRFALYAHLVAHWIIGLPIGLFLGFGMGFGAAGIWWGLTAGLVAASVGLSIRFVTASRGRITGLQRPA